MTTHGATAIHSDDTTVNLITNQVIIELVQLVEVPEIC
jgi:hypothetical protein